MKTQLITDDWRRGAILNRLRALEQDHFQHDLNRRVGEALLDHSDGAGREEAQRLVNEAVEAQALLDVSYVVLRELLAELDEAERRNSAEPTAGQSQESKSK